MSSSHKKYVAAKPYVLVKKDGKILHKSAIREGGIITTDGTVSWFSTEDAWKKACLAIDPKAFDAPKKPAK